VFALAAAIILLLSAVGAIESTADVDYLLLGLALWAAHFAVPLGVPVAWPWQRRPPS
jgi:hypothetical protein